MNAPSSTKKLHVSFPATSANLGPGFDALGLALSLRLHVHASLAETFSIVATGRDADQVRQLENNLILTTYQSVLLAKDRTPQPLHLEVHNEIPLGMGCGSSAAALCAGVHLAVFFGDLNWTMAQILDEAARREGHPDNVAACIEGGLTVSRTTAGGSTVRATFGTDLPWRLLLALPQVSLSTQASRALLPESYSRADAVLNVQSTALLVSAFALNRPNLLAIATEDRLHQPFRRQVCPLFAALESLRDHPLVHSVTLSGAGPSTLLIVDAAFPVEEVARVAGPLLYELMPVSIGAGANFGPPFHSK